MFADDQVVERVTGAIREASYSGKGLCKVQVNHKGLRGKGLSIYEEIYVKDAELKDIANSIAVKCQGDADSLGGKQQYMLMFHFRETEDDDVTVELGCRFAVTGQQLDDDGFNGSEPASRKGQHAQIMRHNEGMFETTIRATQGMIGGQNKLLDKAYRRIQHLEDKLDVLQDKQRELLDARHDQEVERLILEKREDRKDEMVEVIKTLAFPLVNKITGMKMLPEGEEGSSAIGQLLDTLDMEQIGKLQSVLKPHQMAVVMAMMQEHVGGGDAPKKLGSG